jgi:hypothetical protein
MDKTAEDITPHVEVDQKLEELKRHLDLIGEGLRGELRLVLEGLARFDANRKRGFEMVHEEIGSLKTLLRTFCGEMDRSVPV